MNKIWKLIAWTFSVCLLVSSIGVTKLGTEYTDEKWLANASAMSLLSVKHLLPTVYMYVWWRARASCLLDKFPKCFRIIIEFFLQACLILLFGSFYNFLLSSRVFSCNSLSFVINGADYKNSIYVKSRVHQVLGASSCFCVGKDGRAYRKLSVREVMRAWIHAGVKSCVRRVMRALGYACVKSCVCRAIHALSLVYFISSVHWVLCVWSYACA